MKYKPKDPNGYPYICPCRRVACNGLCAICEQEEWYDPTCPPYAEDTGKAANIDTSASFAGKVKQSSYSLAYFP